MRAAAVVALSVASPTAFGNTPLTVLTPVQPTNSNALVAAPQAALIVPSKETSILRAGAEVPLTLREELTTKKKKLRVGYRFQMEVSSNVTMNGVTVIPSGTPVVGEVTEIRNKGMWGKSGYIGARVLSARVGDRQIRLTGSFDDKGITGTGGVVAAIAFIPIAGFLTTGTSAMIPVGAPVKSFLDEDIVFETVQAPPQVLVVPSTPQAVPTPTK